MKRVQRGDEELAIDGTVARDVVEYGSDEIDADEEMEVRGEV